MLERDDVVIEERWQICRIRDAVFFILQTHVFIEARSGTEEQEIGVIRRRILNRIRFTRRSQIYSGVRGVRG